jgi:hypothetical protein
MSATTGEKFERLLLELGEVVVPGTHGRPQLGVGPPRLLRGGRPFTVQPLDLVVQGEDRLQGLVVRGPADPDPGQPERREDGTARGAFDGDLQRGALGGGLRLEKIVDGGA